MDVIPKYKIDLARDLRKRQTPSEEKLWQLLRGHRLDGLGFRRQHPIGRFVADFSCNEIKLIIEVDGAYHNTAQQQELDRGRAAHFTGRGYAILRVTADDVIRQIENVIQLIRVEALNANSRNNPESPSPAAGEGLGVGACTEEAQG